MTGAEPHLAGEEIQILTPARLLNTDGTTRHNIVDERALALDPSKTIEEMVVVLLTGPEPGTFFLYGEKPVAELNDNGSLSEPLFGGGATDLAVLEEEVRSELSG